MRCACALLLLLLAGTASVREERQGSPDPQTRFVAVDLYLDSGGAELAAWQLELNDAAGVAKLVGIEGGAHAAFEQPAHHDPKALQTGRVVLAAFDLGRDLPRGRTRVATLTFAHEARQSPDFRGRTLRAAGPLGEELACTLEIER